MTPAALASLLPAVRRRRLERGEYFYRVREPFTHLWVLISGQGRMSMPGPDGESTRMSARPI
jgi:CRP-like cAMP-binding protein